MIIILMILSNSISRCQADAKRIRKGNKFSEIMSAVFLQISFFTPPFLNKESFFDTGNPVTPHHTGHPLEDEEPDDEDIEYSLARNQVESEEEDEEEDDQDNEEN